VTCERCGDPVEYERIVVQPAARVCLGCLSPDEADELERDLQLARSVQSALLPDSEIEIDGYRVHHHYRPLRAVSGDHCDVLPPARPGGPWHFVLGDVSGKGVAASLLMSHLQALFRSLVPIELPLSEVVQHANRLFAQCTLPNSYATLVAGRLDPSGALELCNAGHCPALLVRHGKVSTLEGSGLPLGLFETATYATRPVRLEAGDLLVLYTDGLSESRNADGEQYGVERVQRVLRGINGEAPRRVVEALISDLLAFRGSSPREDDLTLMAIRRTG
jgi:sigma-B regulation protein RsbU (phosphoserine phosphatase)